MDTVTPTPRRQSLVLATPKQNERTTVKTISAPDFLEFHPPDLGSVPPSFVTPRHYHADAPSHNIKAIFVPDIADAKTVDKDRVLPLINHSFSPTTVRSNRTTLLTPCTTFLSGLKSPASPLRSCPLIRDITSVAPESTLKPVRRRDMLEPLHRFYDHTDISPSVLGRRRRDSTTTAALSIPEDTPMRKRLRTSTKIIEHRHRHTQCVHGHRSSPVNLDSARAPKPRVSRRRLSQKAVFAVRRVLAFATQSAPSSPIREAQQANLASPFAFAFTSTSAQKSPTKID
jgi:hypothetical protein